MAGHSEEEIKKQVLHYKLVFGALAVLTVVTVWASNLQVGVAVGVTIGLAIALVKGSMVAAIFMHLVGEKKMIVYIMVVSAVFFAVMMILILGHAADIPTYDG